jgi:hypothetical protein
VPSFRRRRARLSPALADAERDYGATLAIVEEAKAALVATVRAGRAEGVPLADGLAVFETGVREAEGSMAAWRVPEMEFEWTGCLEALAESARLAERLRLEGSPVIYEELIAEIADLLDPLDAFAAAGERFRKLKVRPPLGARPDRA